MVRPQNTWTPQEAVAAKNLGIRDALYAPKPAGRIFIVQTDRRPSEYLLFPALVHWMGGWSQTGRTRELHYIDPSILPSPAAYAFFGWLREGAFRLTTPAWERAPRARARDDPGEPDSGLARAA